MEYDLNLLKHLQDELLNRLNSLSMEQPRSPYNDTYTEIENAANKLSEVDKLDLMKDLLYQLLVTKLNTYILLEQFKLIRENLNKNPEAVNIMNKISEYILKFKTNNDNKKADTLKTFEDYITNYADMSYSDYLKAKEAKNI